MRLTFDTIKASFLRADGGWFELFFDNFTGILECGRLDIQSIRLNVLSKAGKKGTYHRVAGVGIDPIAFEVAFGSAGPDGGCTGDGLSEQYV